MKHLIDKAYARQREISWCRWAKRIEGVGLLAIIVLLCVFTVLRAIWGA